MIGYLDCFSGVSGDMFLGALVHAGLDVDRLRATLKTIGISGWKLSSAATDECHIGAVRARVEVEKKQSFRGLREITALLQQSGLEQRIQQDSLAVFQRLATAEARVHNTTLAKVHFHEVGAMDAVIDIVGVVAGLRLLGIETLFCSPLPMPTGWVKAAHGELPLPAPAVLELIQGLPVYGVDLPQELVTPTGAALVAGLAAAFGPMPPMTVSAVGYGAGAMQRVDKRPNLLRLVVGESLHVGESQQVTVVETNLDDWSPEGFPHVAQRLFAGGALDVNLVPMQMKKGRPGFLLRVIAPPERDLEIKNIILSETTALGLRFRSESRMTLPRREITVTTPWGPVQAQEVATPAGTVCYPEYESCRRLARENKVPLLQVYRAVNACGGSPPDTV